MYAKENVSLKGVDISSEMNYNGEHLCIPRWIRSQGFYPRRALFDSGGVYQILKKDIVTCFDKTLGYEYFIDTEHPLCSNGGKVYFHRHVASRAYHFTHTRTHTHTGAKDGTVT